LIGRDVQIDLAHERLNGHDLRDPLAYASHGFDLRSRADDSRPAQNLSIRLAADLQLLLRIERKRLLPVPWPFPLRLDIASRNRSEDTEQGESSGKFAHRVGSGARQDDRQRRQAAASNANPAPKVQRGSSNPQAISDLRHASTSKSSVGSIPASHESQSSKTESRADGSEGELGRGASAVSMKVVGS
jgi:hypothetical protein